MSDKAKLDEVRNAILDRIERAQRNFLFALCGAAAVEALVIVAFLLGMERGNRLHLLLLIASFGSYNIVVMSLIVLGAYINRGHLRILKAIELLKSEMAERLKKEG